MTFKSWDPRPPRPGRYRKAPLDWLAVTVWTLIVVFALACYGLVGLTIWELAR